MLVVTRNRISMIILRTRPNPTRMEEVQADLVQADLEVEVVEVFPVEGADEAVTRLMMAAMTMMTVGTMVEGDVRQEEGDVRQEEDEDHPMAEMTMAQEGVAAAQEVVAGTDQWGVGEEVGADLMAAGADLTLISLIPMLRVVAEAEQAQAQVQRTTLF